MPSCSVISTVRRSLVLLVTMVAAARAVDAQTDTRMVAAVKLAQDGFADSARAVMRQLLGIIEPTDSLYPEALYTSGVVAATDAERRLALRRVIVEYSQSSWADDALVLLGQTEYAGGNPTATVTQIERLVNDYPTSPLVPVGALWGARAASDLGNGSAACRFATAGLAVPNDDVELRNQLEYQKGRCSALASTVVPDTTKPTTTSADSAKRNRPPETPAKGTIWVQVIAAPTKAKADQSVASLTRAGLDAAIAEEGGFFKVRAGPFATRAAAQSALQKIRARLGGKPFIVIPK